MFSRKSNSDHAECRDGAADEQRCNRRSYLKLTGTLAAATTGIHGVSSHAQAASEGYGEGGYGNGGYGGSSDTSVTVSTDTATNITDTTATLNGSLDDLGGASSADCYFEWRASGETTWTTTTAQSFASPGSFSEDVTELASATDYEYRAIAVASDGDTATGTTKAFTTQNSNQAPTIDSYSVTEAGSPNPHAEITADWNVSDADGDLAQVNLTVHDSTGDLRDAQRHSVSGADATGTDTFKIKHATGETFDVACTVIDTAGNRTSDSKQVTG